MAKHILQISVFREEIYSVEILGDINYLWYNPKIHTLKEKLDIREYPFNAKDMAIAAYIRAIPDKVLC